MSGKSKTFKNYNRNRQTNLRLSEEARELIVALQEYYAASRHVVMTASMVVEMLIREKADTLSKDGE